MNARLSLTCAMISLVVLGCSSDEATLQERGPSVESGVVSGEAVAQRRGGRAEHHPTSPR